MLKDTLSEARRLRIGGEIDAALDLLLRCTPERPHLWLSLEISRCYLLRGEMDRAEQTLADFEGPESERVGLVMQYGRIREQRGELQAAADHYRRALLLDSDSTAAARCLERVQATLDAEAHRASLESLVDEIERILGAGAGELDALLTRLRDYLPFIERSRWDEDGLYARAAHILFNWDCREALANYHPALIDMSVSLGYLIWPRRIQRYVQGRSVLDVGCRFSAYGAGFLAAGASSYTGLDPQLEMDGLRAKNKRTREWSQMPMTGREAMKLLPGLHLIQGKSEDIAHTQQYDCIVMHNVTEHLMDIDRVFEGLVPLMHQDSKMIFLHHHYYSWNGHHRPPIRLSQYDPQNEQHRRYADWQHVIGIGQIPPDDYLFRNLNRVTLNALRTLVDRLLDIEIWEEQRDTEDILARLTPDIVEEAARQHDVGYEDLATRSVFCVATSKASQ
ncbi:methyltransferase [Microbulbifer sp. TYP-18]|uniref:methyltransferase n=1 Tax=Microbulbifer sp. TYP-18 TaxID=3230024 RepID=UPI0034C6437F